MKEISTTLDEYVYTRDDMVVEGQVEAGKLNQAKTTTTAPDYCVRVTADDGKRGEEHLRDFRDNEKTIPTVLTTSQKLSTGVDARNVRNIVLLRPVNSMIEFKQIIGRGTRLYVKEGVDELDDTKLAPLLKLGPVADIRQLFVGFQHHLYEPALAA